MLQNALKYFFIFTAIFCTYTVSAITINPGDWYKWGGPNGNFIYDDPPGSKIKFDPQKLESPAILWKAEVGKGYSSVTIAGNMVFTMGYDRNTKKDSIYCLDLDSGKPVWQYEYSGIAGNYEGSRATPVIDKNRVYALSRNSILNCLDADKGRLLWSVDLVKKYGINLPNWHLGSSVLIDGDMLLINANEYGVALNKKDGDKIWISPSSLSGYATPVVFDYKGRHLAAMFNGRALCLVEAKSGKKLWSYNWAPRNNVNVADPLYFDGKIFITSSYGTGCTLLDISGNVPKPLWTSHVISSHYTSCVYLDGYIYGVDDLANDSTGKVLCVRPSDGKAMWQTPDIGPCQFVVINKTLVILTDAGNIHMAPAKPDGYSETLKVTKISRPVNFTAPVYCHGKLFIRNSNGTLLCIDVAD